MAKLTFVVSDIHGRLDLLLECLSAINTRAKSGEVIFTGDYVDRGPDSFGVIQRLIDGPAQGWAWKFIRGNHEDFLIDAHNGCDPSCWIGNGGAETIASYGGECLTEHLEWVRSLPRILWDDLRVYTHAGVDEGRPLNEQNQAMTQWYRYPKGADVGYNGRHVVHGHTPQTNGPELYKNRTNLDTGGVFTGKMAIGVFDQTQGPPVDIIHVEIKGQNNG